MSLISITAANVLPSTTASIVTGIAGAALTQGQPVYIDTADSNKIKLCDSNGAGLQLTLAGITVNAASSGQRISYCTADTVGFTLGGTLTAGLPVYVGNTAGSLTQDLTDLAASSTVMQLGGATTTALMLINPQIFGVKTA